ncbi:MAG: hypothetical protein ACKV0T_27755 [Planctomycetales bacterium]
MSAAGKHRTCPTCAERVPANVKVCPYCQESLDGGGGAGGRRRREVDSAASESSDDGTGGLIPYKNMPALMAYYCGVFSVIPCFPLGIAAFVLGIMGLKKAKAEPRVRGQTHAWIGILVGGFFGLVWTVLTVIMVVALILGATQKPPQRQFQQFQPASLHVHS